MDISKENDSFGTNRALRTSALNVVERNVLLGKTSVPLVAFRRQKSREGFSFEIKSTYISQVEKLKNGPAGYIATLTLPKSPPDFPSPI